MDSSPLDHCCGEARSQRRESPDGAVRRNRRRSSWLSYPKTEPAAAATASAAHDRLELALGVWNDLGELRYSRGNRLLGQSRWPGLADALQVDSPPLRPFLVTDAFNAFAGAAPGTGTLKFGTLPSPNLCPSIAPIDL